MEKLSGHDYSQLVTEYILHNYSARGLKVYREVFAGKTIIGKNRRIDILAVQESTNTAFAVECKYQGSAGTVDEKIPYALEDLGALPMRGCLVYGGEGFSAGVLHLLQASELAAYCLPDPVDFSPTKDTRELDHLLAMTFHWWDILTLGKSPELPQRTPPNLFQ